VGVCKAQHNGCTTGTPNNSLEGGSKKRKQTETQNILTSLL
jgi:hypothetical protein